MAERVAAQTGPHGHGQAGIVLTLAFAAAHLLTRFRPAEASGKQIPAFAGPYIAYGERFFMCNDTDWSAVGYLRASHFNPAKPYELQRVTGNVTLGFDIDDSLRGQVRLASRSNNQWKENAFIFNFPNGGCTKLRENVPSAYEALLAVRNLTDSPNCFVPRGNFLFDNHPMNWTFPNFPVMPYGRYRFILTGGFVDSPTSRFCMGVECAAIPKPA